MGWLRKPPCFEVQANDPLGSITVGPNDYLWFAVSDEYTGLYRIATDGVVDEYARPEKTTTEWEFPKEGVDRLAVTEDGRGWFTQSGWNTIGYVVPDD